MWSLSSTDQQTGREVGHRQRQHEESRAIFAQLRISGDHCDHKGLCDHVHDDHNAYDCRFHDAVFARFPAPKSTIAYKTTFCDVVTLSDSERLKTAYCLITMFCQLTYDI